MKVLLLIRLDSVQKCKVEAKITFAFNIEVYSSCADSEYDFKLISEAHIGQAVNLCLEDMNVTKQANVSHESSKQAEEFGNIKVSCSVPILR